MAEDDGCAASLATGEGVGMAEDDGCAALLATGHGNLPSICNLSRPPRAL